MMNCNTTNLLDLPPAVWAVHLGPRLSPRALAALRLASHAAAALVDSVLIRRLALLPTVPWVLQRQRAAARALLEPLAGSAGGAAEGSADAGGGSSCSAGGEEAGLDREQLDQWEQQSGRSITQLSGDPMDSTESRLSALLSKRFSDLEELYLKPASAHDFVRRIDLRAVLLGLLGPSAPPRLAALHLAGWPPPATGPLCASLPAWCPWLSTLVLEGLLGGADDGGGVVSGGGGGGRSGATTGGDGRRGGRGGGSALKARSLQELAEGSGAASGEELGGGEEGSSVLGSSPGGADGEVTVAASATSGGLVAALAALPSLRRLSLRYGAAGGAAGSAVSRHRPPRACPDLSPLTQLTALQLAGVVPNAATVASLAALTGLASLHLELLHDGYDKGMQVLDLSAHTRLTSLVFRARLPGSAAAASLRHHHQHHPLHPLRAPQPSPLPCPAPLRGTLQRLPRSLLALAVDVPPWRPRLDAGAGWAEPAPSDHSSRAAGGGAATATGLSQRRRGGRGKAHEESGEEAEAAVAGSGGGSAGDGYAAAGGPPPLRLLACAPDLLPCLCELGLSVRQLRAIRLVTVPSVLAGGGPGGGSGGGFNGGAGGRGGGGCLGLVPSCGSAVTWDAALAPCGPGCPCAGGCGLLDGAGSWGLGRSGTADAEDAAAAPLRAAAASGDVAAADAQMPGALGTRQGRSVSAREGARAEPLEALAACAALAAGSPPHPGADTVAALRLLPEHLIPLAVPLRAPSPHLQPAALVAGPAAAASAAAVAVAAAREGLGCGPADCDGGSGIQGPAAAAAAAAAARLSLRYIEVSARVNQESAAALITILERAAAPSLHLHAQHPLQAPPLRASRSAACDDAGSRGCGDGGGGERLSVNLTLSLERNVNGAEVLADLAALQTKYGGSGSSLHSDGSGNGSTSAAPGLAIRHLALLDLSAQAAAFPRGYSFSANSVALISKGSSGADASKLREQPAQEVAAHEDSAATATAPPPPPLPPFFSALQALGQYLTTLTLQPVRNMLQPLAAALAMGDSSSGYGNGSGGCPALRLLRLHNVEEDGRSAGDRPLLPRLGELMLAFGGCCSTDTGCSRGGSGGLAGLGWNEDEGLALGEISAGLPDLGPTVDDIATQEVERDSMKAKDTGAEVAAWDVGADSYSAMTGNTGEVEGSCCSVTVGFPSAAPLSAASAGTQGNDGVWGGRGRRGQVRALVVPQLQPWEVECLAREVEAVSGGRCACILARS